MPYANFHERVRVPKPFLYSMVFFGMFALVFVGSYRYSTFWGAVVGAGVSAAIEVLVVWIWVIKRGKTPFELRDNHLDFDGHIYPLAHLRGYEFKGNEVRLYFGDEVVKLYLEEEQDGARVVEIVQGVLAGKIV